MTDEAGFTFLNLNPYRKRTGDCVIRAVACALDVDWLEASDALYLTARNIGCEMSCLGCYTVLFSDLGLFEVDVRGMSVGEVAACYPDEVMLIRMKGHLTCARYGSVMDIWDCRELDADRAWIVEQR